jgi:hypothetical protein
LSNLPGIVIGRSPMCHHHLPTTTNAQHLRQNPPRKHDLAEDTVSFACVDPIPSFFLLTLHAHSPLFNAYSLERIKFAVTVAAQGTREFLGHGVSISNNEICIILLVRLNSPLCLNLPSWDRQTLTSIWLGVEWYVVPCCIVG